MNIVFLGTSDFSLKGLVALYENNCNVVAVYTQAPKPSGRKQKIHKSVIHEFAESKGISVFTPKSLKRADQIEIFASLKPDLAIVSSYGLIIPKNMLDIPKYGFVNIHASALPRWRGAAPIQAAILAGDKQSGITIMKMDSGIDTGDIISMQYVDINPKTNHGQLAEDLGNLGAKMIIETLSNLDNMLAKAKKQPNEGATYAQKISKESCKIDWSNSATDILRQIMAFAPIPSAWSEVDGIRVKILDADISSNSEIAAKNVGEICENNGEMFVMCQDSALKITKIQPAGKNVMNGTDFLRGRKNLVGKIFS